MSLSVHGNHVI